MANRMYKLLFSPRGRIGRGPFLAGLAFLILFVLFQKTIWPWLGTGMAAFFVPMILFFVTFHIMLCLFGKRLHDIGRSLWPFTGLMAFMIVMFLVVMLKYGGLEYFNTVMAHPEYADRPDEMRRVAETYQAALKAGLPQARVLMAIPPLLFTLWLAVRPGESGPNAYGPA